MQEKAPMYLCVKCKKAFKVISKSQNVKCPYCSEFLFDMNVSLNEWQAFDKKTRHKKIDESIMKSKESGANNIYTESISNKNESQIKEEQSEIIKQVNLCRALHPALEKYVDNLISTGLADDPPKEDDDTLLVPVNCWFDKATYISLYLLREHKIHGIQLSHHGIPQLQIYIKKANLELIRQVSLNSLDGARWCESEYIYKDAYNYVTKTHPFETYHSPSQYPVANELELKMVHDFIAEYNRIAEKYETWIRDYKNNIYKMAVRDYGKIPYVSEFRLYHFIQYIFPDAIYQYRSDWLRDQSLDIYIPSLKCGIEYQGEQHYEAVDFFGGETKLTLQQKLDQDKKEKCSKNGIKLVEWPYTIWISESEILKNVPQWTDIDLTWLNHEYIMESMNKNCPETVGEFLQQVALCNIFRAPHKDNHTDKKSKKHPKYMALQG